MVHVHTFASTREPTAHTQWWTVLEPGLESWNEIRCRAAVLVSLVVMASGGERALTVY